MGTDPEMGSFLKDESDEISNRITMEQLEKAAAMIQDEKLVAFFTYYAPTDIEKSQYMLINEAALNLARVIMQNCPQCADTTAAIRKVREARMTANAAIACHGVSL